MFKCVEVRMSDYDKLELITTAKKLIQNDSDIGVSHAIELFHKTDNSDLKMAILVALAQFDDSKSQEFVEYVLQDEQLADQLRGFVSDVPKQIKAGPSSLDSRAAASRSYRSNGCFFLLFESIFTYPGRWIIILVALMLILWILSQLGIVSLI